MSACVVLIPVLNRPHRVAPLLESLATSDADARPVFICSPGDTAEHEAIDKSGADIIIIDRPPGPGDYAIKINVGYHATSAPLLFLGADDLYFHRRWLQRCQRRLTPGIGVVGTNDMTNPRVMRGAHSTHSLVTRIYADQHGTIDEPRKILHEGYHHEYVDDELVGTAKKRNAFAFARDAMVEHLHPMAGKAPMDALYEQQATRMRLSRRLYIRRQRLWT